jgi:hypothetical protein
MKASSLTTSWNVLTCSVRLQLSLSVKLLNAGRSKLKRTQHSRSMGRLELNPMSECGPFQRRRQQGVGLGCWDAQHTKPDSES